MVAVGIGGAHLMRKKHRHIEFDVHPLDDNGWEWVVYPKIGEGVRFPGAVEVMNKKQ